MLATRFLLIASCGALLLFTGRPLDAAEIEALGAQYSESVQSISGQGDQLTVRTGQRSLPLDAIKAIRFQALSSRAGDGSSKLLLTNGDWLRGSLEGGDDEAIGLRSDALGTLRIPLELVRAVIPPNLGAERERQLEAQLQPGDGLDSVLLAKNAGTARGSLLRVDGTKVVLDTRKDEVGDDASGIGVPEFDYGQVELIAIALLDEPPPPPKGLRVVLRLTDGSTLTGKLLSLQNNTAYLKHPLVEDGGLAVAVPRLAELVVENGRFVYLSDLEPSEVDQHFPPEYTYEVEVWGWKRDANVMGDALRLDGTSYGKGLGVHSYCALSYRLDGAYATFKAVVGLDDSTRYLGEPGFGSVVFKLLLDGKPAKEFPSGIVQRKGQKPTPIELDVRGVKTLTLVADLDPISLHVLGRANWADAHLVKGN